MGLYCQNQILIYYNMLKTHMINLITIRKKLENLNPDHLEIIDDSEKHRGHNGYNSEFPSHIRIIIVSASFQGKSLIQRHKMIHNLLSEELAAGLHALSIKANTPTTSK